MARQPGLYRRLGLVRAQPSRRRERFGTELLGLGAIAIPADASEPEVDLPRVVVEAGAAVLGQEARLLECGRRAGGIAGLGARDAEECQDLGAIGVAGGERGERLLERGPRLRP